MDTGRFLLEGERNGTYMFEWTQDLSVGNAVLDNDHKVLFRLVNNYIDAVDQDKGTLTIDSVFREFIAYTEYHFAREERVLAACGYVQVDDHHAEHESIKEELLDHGNRYLNSCDKTLDDKVREFLRTWLFHHICEVDFAYRESLVGHEDAIAEALAQPLA